MARNKAEKREYDRRRRDAETHEERDLRLARGMEIYRNRVSTETPEERAERLKRNREAQLRYRNRNLEFVRNIVKDWRRRNPDADRVYRSENKDYYRDHCRVRRAVKLGNESEEFSSLEI